MKYRRDIDGLRAIAVLSVILFHSGIAAVPGGYIGVDVFFVISGYLITTLIYKEIKKGDFTFGYFYRRRAARLLPALSITLLFVLTLGFVFYNNKAFDNLGKELFFSSIGAANILFAQGINYFAKDEAYQPLIHLWSLGVEEQFYVVWPVLLLFIHRLSLRTVIAISCVLLIASLMLSMHAVNAGQTKGYFLPQYRAFELLTGVITALLLFRSEEKRIDTRICNAANHFGSALIIAPMFFLDKDSGFPGINALWPCLGTALVIGYPGNGFITKLLSNKILVFFGLISYPLYLYHQPIISLFRILDFRLSPIELFTAATTIATLLSWLTYKYIEIPIRRNAHNKAGRVSFATMGGLISTIPFFAVTGLGIAKSGGLEERFKYLNPFAFKISQKNASTFHQNFERGFKVAPAKHGKALFIGDSVLQHYVVPMSSSLDLALDEIDSVTRGGCVLLKGVEFIDKFADISCNDLRDELYASKKAYDYIIVSQDWDSYDDSITNYPNDADRLERWLPFLNLTIGHFSKLSHNIIVIGNHPRIDGTPKLQPTITINVNDYISNLDQLAIANISDLRRSREFFQRLTEKEGVQVIEPYDIFCHNECTLHDDIWSYFSDTHHLTLASTNFVVSQLKPLLGRETPDNVSTRKN